MSPSEKAAEASFYSLFYSVILYVTETWGAGIRSPEHPQARPVKKATHARGLGLGFTKVQHDHHSP